MQELTPGQNGLPPKQKHYSPARKALLVAKAAEVGVHPIAEAYGFAWQTIASWKRYLTQGEKKAPLIIIQSPDGREITVDEVKEKAGVVEKVYVRADEGKAYWVKGEEHGAVELW